MQPRQMQAHMRQQQSQGTQAQQQDVTALEYPDNTGDLNSQSQYWQQQQRRQQMTYPQEYNSQQTMSQPQPQFQAWPEQQQTAGYQACDFQRGAAMSPTQPAYPTQPDLQQQLQWPNSQEGELINQLAKRLMDTCPPDVKARFQGDINTWPEERKQQLTSQGIDPLFYRFRQQAEFLYRSGKLNNKRKGDD